MWAIVIKMTDAHASGEIQTRTKPQPRARSYATDSKDGACDASQKR
jgi:hypothetical protein